MASMMATAQTTATCHSPDRAPVRTATWTAPQPKKTSRNVPSVSARHRAGRGLVRTPIRRTSFRGLRCPDISLVVRTLQGLPSGATACRPRKREKKNEGLPKHYQDDRFARHSGRDEVLDPGGARRRQRVEVCEMAARGM